jgi:peptide deformylase
MTIAHALSVVLTVLSFGEGLVPPSTDAASRRDFLHSLMVPAIADVTLNNPSSTVLTPITTLPGAGTRKTVDENDETSTRWTGTNLKLQSIEEASSLALASKNDHAYWAMGRWPDPMLRRPADPVDPQWYGTGTLTRAGRLLTETARREGAVGLAAQQCGVNARMIYLEQPNGNSKNEVGILLVNPYIVGRSPEKEMKVWMEECLVLPPTFRATVLRDAWIDVQYHTLQGDYRFQRFRGEQSRCIQHEMDHDRGILITDHVGLEELESDTMRRIEERGHEQRMALAYNRYITTPISVGTA